MQFRLTFNKPAYEMFFRGDDAQGVRIKIADGIVQFKPTNSLEGNDVVPVSQRGTRGGLQAIVAGTHADAVLDAMKNEFGNPFFVLQRMERGWIGAHPHQGPAAEPTKVTPVVRVWVQGYERRVAPQLLEELNRLDLPQFLDEVREAKKITDDYEKLNKAGRPPMAVMNARDTLRLFTETARDVLPLGGLFAAHAELSRFLGLSPTTMPQTISSKAAAEERESEETEEAPAAQSEAGQPRRRSTRAQRGSASESASAAPEEAPKTRRGRPPGSKNKAKPEPTSTTAPASASAPTAATAPVTSEAPKTRRGRPPKSTTVTSEAPKGKTTGGKGKVGGSTRKQASAAERTHDTGEAHFAEEAAAKLGIKFEPEERVKPRKARAAPVPAAEGGRIRAKKARVPFLNPAKTDAH